MNVKPFPWKCTKCRSKSVVPAIVDYSTEIDHDGRSYDVSIPGLEIPKCQHCGALAMTDDVSRKITAAFRNKIGLFQPEEIRRHRI